MLSSHLRPSLRPTTLFLGMAGLIISWVAFGEYALKEGPDIVGFLEQCAHPTGTQGSNVRLNRMWGDPKHLGSQRYQAPGNEPGCLDLSDDLDSGGMRRSGTLGALVSRTGQSTRAPRCLNSDQIRDIRGQ